MPPPPIPPPPIPPRPNDVLYAPVYIPYITDRPSWPIPTFELRAEDISHPGARIFFENVQPADVLRDAVIAVCSWLYTPQDVPTNVQSVLLVLRPGLACSAYATGSHTHKEIHLSLEHVRSCAARARDEIRGVLTHEMVHCFQHDARGTCPGGLIEGIADWVRLRAGLAAPHWKEGHGDKWDAGYEKTAYFLGWIEEQCGKGTIWKLNAGFKDREYNELIFQDLTGSTVQDLWRLYQLDLESRQGQGQ
ncbi:hypothetical protein AcW1_001230 [Taiwanofungus camphoratus]|nr:hypothetical protein AcW2_000263 [Antrodia cinnamomea]KAI0937182.1 hypothetical protein AcV5_005141 [Antrodia cinnamomea]KAI0964400.1 hypothetical protein AcW1_001230 [Antrodia cinnamomea]